MRWSVLLALALALATASQGQKNMNDAKPTADFRAEHVQIKEHLGHVHQWIAALRTAPAGDRKQSAQKIVGFFETHIEPHAAWEERFLYPVVDRLAGGGAHAFTATMRHEHRIVGRWIGELRTESQKTELDVEKFARRADNLLGLIWAHFEEEEEVLLPLIDKGMTKAQFDRALGGAGRAH